uniref:Putative secreted protein n=1 Tax=Amblyomma cajennense TaxID=34607 RepID=A0A023FC39_AMBCJ
MSRKAGTCPYTRMNSSAWGVSFSAVLAMALPITRQSSCRLQNLQAGQVAAANQCTSSVRVCDLDSGFRAVTHHLDLDGTVGVGLPHLKCTQKVQVVPHGRRIAVEGVEFDRDSLERFQVQRFYCLTDGRSESLHGSRHDGNGMDDSQLKNVVAVRTEGPQNAERAPTRARTPWRRGACTN